MICRPGGHGTPITPPVVPCPGDPAAAPPFDSQTHRCRLKIRRRPGRDCHAEYPPRMAAAASPSRSRATRTPSRSPAAASSFSFRRSTAASASPAPTSTCSGPRPGFSTSSAARPRLPHSALGSTTPGPCSCAASSAGPAAARPGSPSRCASWRRRAAGRPASSTAASSQAFVEAATHGQVATSTCKCSSSSITPPAVPVPSTLGSKSFARRADRPALASGCSCSSGTPSPNEGRGRNSLRLEGSDDSLR